jgi:HD-like signal output (HDOD) protein/ActR/RegA family two-component response regulator
VKQRIRVAFVDDDANILTSLRRTMLTMLDEWEMAFFKSAPDLLERLETETFDVVVSDMRMPGMDGAALLDVIAKRHPDTIRAILSGYADNESIFRTVGPAHAYLAKPCDPALLRQAIRGRIALRGLLEKRELRQLLGGLSSLPSAPRLFSDLLAEMRSPTASAGAVADLIGRDMAMTAELLKLTNSSYFALSAPVSSALAAVRILGLDLIQTLVLQIGIFRQFDGTGDMARHVEALSFHSHEVGDLAEKAALGAGEPNDVAKAARSAGILSEIGSLVLLSERAEDYRSACVAAGNGQSRIETETRIFGTDHAMVGAYLLGLWGFADTVVEAVAHAARPGLTAGGPNPVLAALHIAQAVGPSFPLIEPPVATGPVDEAYLARLDQENPQRCWRRIVTDLKGSAP